MPDSTPGVYLDLIDTLISAESDRKASIEQKSSAIISSSAALVTILFGLVAVITNDKGYQLPRAAHGWLTAAIVAFVVAASLSILLSIPVPYGQTNLAIGTLAAHWSDPVARAQAAVAGVRLEALAAARRVNTYKAYGLIAATSAELVALVLLAVAIYQVIRSA